MSKRVLLAIIFLLGIAVGQTNRYLTTYGCTDIQNNYNGATYNTKICIVYDPNMDKHFIVTTGTAGGVAIVEEK